MRSKSKPAPVRLPEGEPLLDLALRHGKSPEVIRRAIRLGKLKATRHKNGWYVREENFLEWRRVVDASRFGSPLPCLD